MSYYFPEAGKDSGEVLNEIESICANDFLFEEGRILNSICSEPLPVSVKAFCQTIHTNLGDSRIFPGIKNIEEINTRMIGELLGHPGAVGNVVSGGTEANLLALFAARRRGEKRGISSPEVIVPLSVHFSVEKVAAILGIKLRYTKLDSNYRADPEDIKRAVTPNTIAILVTAGTSELGVIDPVSEIAAIAERYDLYFHVDAASGGFIIPFAKELGYNLAEFDFKIPKVDSITVDPHKFALTVIPSGYILFRSKEIQKLVEFESHYVGTSVHTTFTGTRSGASAASVYAVINSLGRQGFREIVKGYFDKRDFLIEELHRYHLDLLINPDLNIVAIKSRDPEKALRKLEEKKWLISVSKRNSSLRVVIHHHLQKKHLSDFVEELSEVERSLV